MPSHFHLLRRVFASFNICFLLLLFQFNGCATQGNFWSLEETQQTEETVQGTGDARADIPGTSYHANVTGQFDSGQSDSGQSDKTEPKPQNEAKILEFPMDLLNAIYRECCSDAALVKNTVLSPISASILLAMASAGLRGEMAAEIVNVLADGDALSLHQNNAKFIKEIKLEEENEFKLNIANKIYSDEKVTISEEFKETLTKYYQGNFESINFRNADEASKEINTFVSESTNGKIQEIVTPNDLQNAENVLINAIYLKANWWLPFDARFTAKKSFSQMNGDKIKIDTMTNTTAFIYHAEKNFQLLGIEMKRGNAQLFIVLPRENDGLTKVLGELKENELMKLVKEAEEKRVEVFLPKFKIESTHNLELILPSLGIKSMFDPRNANSSGGNDLYISKILQKAMISIDEYGCEAAAVTGGMMCGASAKPPPPPPVFRANHPFAFFLVKNKENVLFSGVFMGEEEQM